jgi:hypothetical protein
MGAARDRSPRTGRRRRVTQATGEQKTVLGKESKKPAGKQETATAGATSGGKA